MEKPFVHENIKCSKQTLVLSNIALVHLIACLVYMVLTINMGTPFYDSLTEEQKKIKNNSSRKRSHAYTTGILLGIVVLIIWKPLK